MKAIVATKSEATTDKLDIIPPKLINSKLVIAWHDTLKHTGIKQQTVGLS